MYNYFLAREKNIDVTCLRGATSPIRNPLFFVRRGEEEKKKEEKKKRKGTASGVVFDERPWPDSFSPPCPLAASIFAGDKTADEHNRVPPHSKERDTRHKIGYRLRGSL